MIWLHSNKCGEKCARRANGMVALLDANYRTILLELLSIDDCLYMCMCNTWSFGNCMEYVLLLLHWWWAPKDSRFYCLFEKPKKKHTEKNIEHICCFAILLNVEWVSVRARIRLYVGCSTSNDQWVLISLQWENANRECKRRRKGRKLCRINQTRTPWNQRVQDATITITEKSQ